MDGSKIISVYIQKGGCGKTTTAASLAVLLAKKGYRVLLLDCDPQANLTLSLKMPVSSPTLYDVFMSRESEYRPQDYVRTLRDGLDAIPADARLAELDSALSGRMSREFILKKFLHKRLGVKGFYDFTVIDCPPSAGVLPLNALAASDSVIVPVTAEFLSLNGYVQLRSMVDEIREDVNPSLEIEGVLITRFSASRRGMKVSHREIEGALQLTCGSLLYDTRIRENARVMDAPRYGKTVTDYAPESNGAVDYENFAEEFLKKQNNV